MTKAGKDNQELSPEVRKRFIEMVLVLITTTLLVLISRLETRLFELSDSLSRSRDFISTIIYFAIINLNVILILLLSFLVFRNVTKLIVERRHGVFGSNLRAKLVLSLVVFALAPTVLVFYISSRFITNSFDTWFSERVKRTMEQTKEASNLVYEPTKLKMQAVANLAKRRIRLQVPDEYHRLQFTKLDLSSLKDFSQEYGIKDLQVYGADGHLMWASVTLPHAAQPYSDYIFSAMEKLQKDHELQFFTTVVAGKERDLIKGVTPLYDPTNRYLLGVIYTQETLDTNIIGSLELIVSEFASFKPSAELIKFSFMFMMVVMTLLIIFAAVWLGFYVAREITQPLQRLAQATRQIALGNYSIQLEATTSDESGVLIHSFNQMTKDLQIHKETAEAAQNKLQKSYQEIEQRRQYMEIVLKNITTGVIALDQNEVITSVNNAAEKLLAIHADLLIGKSPKNCFDAAMYRVFWEPIEQGLSERGYYHSEIDLVTLKRKITLIVDAVRLYDEHGRLIGVVLVFDDEREKVMAQRAAAWREVARRIAHEIKNPLTPIKLSTQRILRRFHDRFEGEDQEVFTTCIETILMQVDSLRNLVNEFSKFSRLPDVRTRPEDLNEIVHDVVNVYRMSYPNVTFDISRLGNIPPIPVDKEQMNRVLANLLGNAQAAIKDLLDQGRIVVTTEHLSDRHLVRLSVADNGIGIPAELKDRVLEPYFSTKDEGTGLGLAIVNQIISDHGGYLRIVDNEPKGTVVIIELPLNAKKS